MKQLELPLEEGKENETRKPEARIGVRGSQADRVDSSDSGVDGLHGERVESADNL